MLQNIIDFMCEKGHIFFLGAVVLCFTAAPMRVLAEEGSHAAEFLSHGVGARALGMGSSFVSIADDATATYWNPAGLVQIPRRAFAAMYSDSFGATQEVFSARGWWNTTLSVMSNRLKASGVWESVGFGSA